MRLLAFLKGSLMTLTLSPRVAPASHKSAVCAASSLAGVDGVGFPPAVADCDGVLSCGVHAMELRGALKTVDAVYDNSVDWVLLQLAPDSSLNVIAYKGGRAHSNISTLYPVEGVITGGAVLVSRHQLLVAIDALGSASLTLRGLACGGVRLISLSRDFMDVVAPEWAGAVIAGLSAYAGGSA